VTKWRVKNAHGFLALQVLRRRPGGTFKSIRSTGARFEDADPGEIIRRNANLRIRKRDFVAVRTTGFPTGSFGFSDFFAGARGRFFDPGLADGERKAPTSSTAPDRLWLYNAKLVR